MGDISAAERRLIDEAIAEGRVQHVPAGARAINDDLRYNPISNRVEYVDRDVARMRANTGSTLRRRKGPQPDPGVALRRGRVAALLDDGKGIAEICAALQVRKSTVYQDARALKKAIPRTGQTTSRHDPIVARNRAQVKAAFDGVRTVGEIAEITGISRRTVSDHLKALDLTPPRAKPGPARTSRLAQAVAERREQVKALALEGLSGPAIAKALGVNISTVYVDCRTLDVALPRARGAGDHDKAARRKQVAADRKVAQVRDRRRFKTVPVPMGDPAILAPRETTGTMFPSRVFEPTDDEPVLKDGSNQSKIGGDVLVGWLKGARIYTLTLEERATCPGSCRHWQSCYGNSMPHPRRWRHGDALMARIEAELDTLCVRHDRVLLRLHVLGDFWSVAYVAFWERMLSEHPDLYIFGFTAHKQGTEIGDAIADVRVRHEDRFWMRHSDMTGPWGSFTIDFPTELKTIGDAIVCPEQRGGMSGSRLGTHCGNCAVCWSAPSPIAFVTH